jgi:1-acyl-sn-glycerol-3-phosphate acyltransferase
MLPRHRIATAIPPVIESTAQVATFIQENGTSQRVPTAAAQPFRPWRVALRALGFATFGLVSGGLGVIVLPLQRLVARWHGITGADELRGQYAIHLGMRLWVWLANACGIASVSVRGGHKFRTGPLVVVANHPSLIDTPILLSVLPQADLIVNASWGDNPFLKGCVDGAGYLRAERGAVIVRHAIENLREGRILVVFPEGSRTPPEGLRSFERGAAQIALVAGCDVVPVVISVHPRTLMKGQPFTDVPDHCPEWRVEVGDPIHPGDFVRSGEGSSAAARRLTGALQEYFEKRWERVIC